MFRRLLVLAPVLIAALMHFAGRAWPCDPPARCGYRTVTGYEKVTVYETKSVPYTKTVTSFDECGRPCTVRKVCYRDEQVPVSKWVAVVKQVKVGE